MSNQDWEDGYETGYQFGLKEGIETSWHRVSKEGYVRSLSNDRVRELDEECRLKNNGILNVLDLAKAIELEHGIREAK